MSKVRRLASKTLKNQEIDKEMDNVISIRKGKKRTDNNFSLRTIKPLTPNQNKVFEAYNNGKHIICSGSAGTGKAQPLYSKILTPNGWTTMGEINVGDYILTPKGKVSKVVEIFHQGKKDVYRIYLKDGSYTDCCLDHLWEINVPNNKKYRDGSHVEIVDTKTLISYLDIYGTQNISINVVCPIEFSEKELPIHPYILGALLGDGCFRSGSVTISTIDDDILKEINNNIENDYYINKHKNADSYLITHGIKGKENFYKENLINFGLWGKKSEDKFIPEIYIQSSIEQRLNLIKGLMDTDGTVDKKGIVSYSTSSKILANQIKEIILSLGGKCSIKLKTPFYYDENKNRIYCLDNYILNINIPNKKELFNLNRKKEKCYTEFDIKQHRRQILNIELIGNDECKCILIDDPEHLYITDDYIITHNTFLLMYLMLQDAVINNNYEKIVVYRTPVQTRNMGFTPGSDKEKIDVYNQGIKSICIELLGRGDAFELLEKKGKIEFTSTSFARSITHNNTLVLFEEAQSATLNELSMVSTRIGENSRIFFTGDTAQNDLDKREKSGFLDLIRISDLMDSMEVINFTTDDVVRSGFCRDYIIAKEKLGL